MAPFVTAAAASAGHGASHPAALNSATQGMDLYLVTPCPLDIQDKGAHGNP